MEPTYQEVLKPYWNLTNVSGRAIKTLGEEEGRGGEKIFYPTTKRPQKDAAPHRTWRQGEQETRSLAAITRILKEGSTPDYKRERRESTWVFLRLT